MVVVLNTAVFLLMTVLLPLLLTALLMFGTLSTQSLNLLQLLLIMGIILPPLYFPLPSPSYQYLMMDLLSFGKLGFCQQTKLQQISIFYPLQPQFSLSVCNRRMAL